jgi:hypothetical protein
MRFSSFDHYYQVFKDKGLDYLDREEKTGFPKKILLDDFLKAGRENLSSFKNNNVTFRDTIMTPDISPWLPQVIERTVMEAVEPRLVISSLFQRMPYTPGMRIEYPAMGALEAHDLAEGQRIPLQRMQEGGATQVATVGKVGTGFSLSQETISRSQYDLMAKHLQNAGYALARRKETKAVNFLVNLGTTSFDNLSPTNSMYGVTTGRDIAGAANGSLTLDDLIKAFIQVMLQGFEPDTIIVHPLTFAMFLRDQELKAFALAGGGGAWYGGWSGNVAGRGPGSVLGVSGGQVITPASSPSGDAASAKSAYSQTMDASFNLPDRWPWPVRIVVSPFMPFNTASERANIIVADSNYLGLLVEEYGPRVARWDDLEREVVNTKITESYSFYMAEEGLPVTVLRGVKTTPNMIILPAQATQDVTGTIAAIDPAVPV